ncbi:MAG: hypothetical protein U5N58_04835 [Actinomycetota bacterium]|nr:hypothetical protein [Actinomycetota bacterium]
MKTINRSAQRVQDSGTDWTEITVTADAAMLSSKNVQALEDMGYHYVIGSEDS